jgi:hypothetical protein
VTYSIMSELLQFMYQGQVNVKQSELQAFMTIAETLQIKGLATSSNNSVNHNNDNSQQTLKTPDSVNSATNYNNQFNQINNNLNNGRSQNQNHYNAVGSHLENHRQTTSTPLSSNSSVDNHSMKGKRAGDDVENICRIDFLFDFT